MSPTETLQPHVGIGLLASAAGIRVATGLPTAWSLFSAVPARARGLPLFLALVTVSWGSILRFSSLEAGPDGSPAQVQVPTAHIATGGV